MNKIEEILSMFDLEVDEEFKVKGHDGLYNVNDVGGVRRGNFFEGIGLIQILNGTYEIVKVKKFPKVDTEYWYVNSKGMKIWETFSSYWYHFNNFKIGNYYLNKEDITQEEIDKWVEWYNNPALVDVFGD